LIPTSGSTGARKLIPFTAGLQQQFDRAISPWMADLARQHPQILFGPAYWSITPANQSAEKEKSMVPIGFDDDSSYLGGNKRRLVDSVLAVPSELRLVPDMEQFHYLTLLCLLRQQDLRLISIWHPTFLSLLLEALPANWETLLADISSGKCRHAAALPPTVRSALKMRPLPRLAARLRTVDPQQPEEMWPHLKLISCWGDGLAGHAAVGLKKLLPNVTLQSKGLLATEAFVTVPFAGMNPLTVRSHFFEFSDDTGAIHRVHELREGKSYEVIVTTAGGLWRYRLRDLVQVAGYVGKTPSLRFLNRSGNVSDLVGEKLSEAFVAEAIQESLDTPMAFVLLAPDADATGFRYTLYVEGRPPSDLAVVLDQALRRNPHYDYCRKLRQLLEVRLFAISGGGFETYAKHRAARGARLGEIKPAILSQTSGWSARFSGGYVLEKEFNKAKGIIPTVV
jgi:hypothetical protein